MSRPANLRYLKSHEWCKLEGNIATIGITDFAVSHLSDLVFLDLPEVKTDTMRGEPFGEIESVKAVSDLYAPMTGEIIERNERLQAELDLLGKDPFGEGWMLKIRVEKPAEWESLLDDAAYQHVIDAESH
jgi:glycine cleavage system H protein